jgi:hypothetical protein
MSKHNLTLRDQTTEFLLYTAPNGAIKVEVLLSNETIWLTQKRMAELFGVGVPGDLQAPGKHLRIGRIAARGNSFRFGNSSTRGLRGKSHASWSTTTWMR